MFPDAGIPLVEMSLDRNLDPQGHLSIGEMLAPLRDEGVLIVASGNIVHNLSLWRQSMGMKPEWAEDFRARVNAAILGNDRQALMQFDESDQSAQLAVNSGEHFIPLLYAMGARQPGDEARLFNDTLDGSLSMTSVLIGDTSLLDGIA